VSVRVEEGAGCIERNKIVNENKLKVAQIENGRDDGLFLCARGGKSTVVDGKK